MKYNFLFKKIIDINDSVLDRLEEYAMSVDYGDNLGFYKGKGIRTHMIENVADVQLAIDAISTIVSPNGYLNSYVNILPANHYIFEHSDVGEGKFFNDNLTIHKIHIPLITNQSSGHMWKCYYEENKQVAVNFERGASYLFNNIDIHSAVNFSSNEDRYHLILRYRQDSIAESFYS